MGGPSLFQMKEGTAFSNEETIASSNEGGHGFFK
jgi:hypothetical protein